MKSKNFSINSPNKPIGLNTILTFGKYKGNTIAELLEIDKDYVKWLVTNVTTHTFTATVHKRI